MMLESHIFKRECVPPDIRETMLALHARHFENVRREQFMMDLEEKDWVILLFDRHGCVVGFSTQKLIVLPVEGRDVRFLFSGDTVVDRAHWNTPMLAGSFGHLMIRLLETFGEKNLFWLLISKGFRTYRFLPVFFNRFWPAPGREMPPDMAALLAAIARSRFGDAYDSSDGIIRPRNGDRLMPALAHVPPERLLDPYVAYFLSRNPGHARGEELACLVPICRDNFNGFADRVIRGTHPVWQ